MAEVEVAILVVLEEVTIIPQHILAEGVDLLTQELINKTLPV